MPLRSIEITPGNRVFLRFCDGCGIANAPFGLGSLHEAIRTKDPSKVKVWCGSDGCRLEGQENAHA